MSHAIAIKDLVVVLKGRRILASVTAALQSGGMIALIGPNGAGKSTLLRSMAGLVASEQGEIRVDDQLLHSIDPVVRARRIAYVPQERTVAWPLPVRAVVALGRLPHQTARSIETNADRRAIDAAMAAMDVTALADRPVLDLSGGERARVLMARALAQEPGILLADEPASGLDPAHQWALFEHLAQLATHGVLVIAAMHDLTLAARFSTHIVLMDEGRIVATGTPESVLAPQTLASIYGITAETREIDGRRVIVQTGLSSQHAPRSRRS